MNTENALTEKIRKYNEKMAYQKEKDKVDDKQLPKECALVKILKELLVVSAEVLSVALAQ